MNRVYNNTAYNLMNRVYNNTAYNLMNRVHNNNCILCSLSYMLYYSCFFSFLGIIKYKGLHNLVYRVQAVIQNLPKSQVIRTDKVFK
jgi:hypothetical protein